MVKKQKARLFTRCGITGDGKDGLVRIWTSRMDAASVLDGPNDRNSILI
ncbi:MULTISPECIES: hypothetical protein [unclassified Paenibacillus]|nr:MULTISPECIES: hypothetical protein [unclassified Paenibacillus]MBD8842410.1 hypothetical protein [Paenibacillus sp. CFBP 13594]MDQ0722888.1 hypothetical protein [Paenibacillus sp. W4I10]